MLGRLFWHQYGSNWTLHYAAADKNHRGVLCREISSSDTAAMQERFWQKQCTWWKDNSTFSGQISEDRKCGRCPQRPTLFIVRHNSWEYSEFTGTPWGFPRKSTRRLSQENGISKTSVLRILHDDLKLFPYKIQILQRQTDQNKAERETFCEDISQRIENDPGLLDLNDLNDFDHCGLCGHLLHFLSPEFGHRTLNCPSVKYIVPVKISPALPLCRKNWVCGKVHIDDFCRLLRSKSSSWIHIGVKRISQACCLNHPKNMEQKL